MISYKLREKSLDEISWKLDNEYPFIKTIIVKRKIYFIEKYFLNIILLDERVFDKIYEDEIEVKRVYRFLNERLHTNRKKNNVSVKT